MTSSKPGKGSEWCEHLVYKEFAGINDYWYPNEWNHLNYHNVQVEPNFKFCPICGTPKPDNGGGR